MHTLCIYVGMTITKFTKIMGILFVLAAVGGFVPGLLHAPHTDDPNLVVDSFYGRLMGLFPVNVLHNLVHLLLGIWALVASKNVASSIVYCRASSIFYGFLVLIGLVPALNTMFGLVPIFGHDVWLHIAFTIPLAYYGYVHANVAQHKRKA